MSTRSRPGWEKMQYIHSLVWRIAAALLFGRLCRSGNGGGGRRGEPAGVAGVARIAGVAVVVLLAVGLGAGAGCRFIPLADYDRDDDGLIDVATLEQLYAIRYDLDGNGAVDDVGYLEIYLGAYFEAPGGMGCPSSGCVGYELVRSLDFNVATAYGGYAVRPEWTQGQGWAPIGNAVAPYTGDFRGNGHTIANLYINRPDAGSVGLFGGSAGGISELGLTDVLLIAHNGAGALAGWNNGSIRNCYSTGVIEASQNVGGLAGSNHAAGVIADSYSGAQIAADSATGGLVGYNEGGVIRDSYYTGTLFAQDAGGGIAGSTLDGIIERGRFSGALNCSGRTCGGIAAVNLGGRISDSDSVGEVSADEHAAGIAGINQGTVEGSHVTGPVIAQNGDAGGVVGSNYALVRRSYAAGPVSGNHRVGGLVGFNLRGAEVRNSYATGSVSGSVAVGGLVGWNQGKIDGGYAIGGVSGFDDLGGLVGRNSGIARGSYAIGDISGRHRVGGLIGYNSAKGSVTNSYATGRVGGSFEVGGLVGQNSGVLAAGYAAGAVSGERNVGGFAGRNTGYIMDSYWDTETSGLATGVAYGSTEGAAGKTGTELREPGGYDGIYAGWAWGGRRWDFGLTNRRPALMADLDGDGVATREEFGPQQ